MRKIYLVRHCELCSRNYADNMRGLSEKGYGDAEKIVDFFERKKVDLIFSSPYKRAIDTMKPLAQKKNMKIVELSDFRERKIGKVVEDFDDFAKRQWEDFTFKLYGGDSLKEVQDKNIEALKKILSENTDKNIVISGHGTAISTILNYYSEFNFKEFKELKDVMPFVVEMEFEGDCYKKHKIYKF